MGAMKQLSNLCHCVILHSIAVQRSNYHPFLNGPSRWCTTWLAACKAAFPIWARGIANISSPACAATNELLLDTGALVTPGEEPSMNQAFTLDARGFSTYRVDGRKAFQPMP